MRDQLLIPQISIRGFNPPTYGENDIIKKENLRDRILSVLPDASISRSACRGKLLSITIQFYIAQKREQGSPKDLYNMLKIFCDTLPDYMDRKKTKNGLGFVEEDNDHAIFEIHCSKELVEDETKEGMNIEVYEWVNKPLIIATDRIMG